MTSLGLKPRFKNRQAGLVEINCRLGTIWQRCSWKGVAKINVVKNWQIERCGLINQQLAIFCVVIFILGFTDHDSSDIGQDTRIADNSVTSAGTMPVPAAHH